MTTRLIAPFFVILVAGCVATGPRFTRLEPPADGKATIYIFRKSNMFDYGGIFPDIKVDGTGSYGLRNNGYLRFEVEPGKHRIEIISKLQMTSLVTWPYREISLDTAAGSTHYVIYHVWTAEQDSNKKILQTAFAELNESDALAILAQTKRIQ